jgi:hypothetical protein
MITIYVLRSTTDLRPRYVGQTAGPLHKRLKSHVAAALQGKSRLKTWVLSEHEAGTLEIAPVIETANPDLEERLLIAQLSKTEDLLNIRRGGRFAPQWKNRRLLRAVTLTPDDNGSVLITCPSLPEVSTFATRPGEIIRRANDAIEEALFARRHVA